MAWADVRGLDSETAVEDASDSGSIADVDVVSVDAHRLCAESLLLRTFVSALRCCVLVAETELYWQIKHRDGLLFCVIERLNCRDAIVGSREDIVACEAARARKAEH